MIVVFSGYNQRAVIAFLRTLNKNRIDNFVIIASSKRDTIFKTSYSLKVVYTRKSGQLDLNEIIEVIDDVYKESNEKCLIAPSTEALNRFLLEHRSRLKEHGCIIPLVERKLYEEISDKEAFGKLCMESGILVPDAIQIPDKFTRPFVAKPKKYIFNNEKIYTPYIITCEEEYTKFKELRVENEFYYQEYIWGESYYLLFYFARNGKCYKLSQENYAQQPEGKSIVIAAVSDIHEENICTEYKKLFDKLQYHGFVMIELRKEKDKYFMIEANPRFWGPSQLFCDAGYNFFEIFLEEYGYIEQAQDNWEEYNKNAVYLWSGGIRKNSLSDCDIVWLGEGKKNFNKSKSEFYKNDIYCRSDTINIYRCECRGNGMEEKIEHLKKLYMNSSKHSNYQILPSNLVNILDTADLVINTRYEQERLEYIKDKIDFNKKKVLDIGGNSGFFSFESCNAGADRVDYFEGNIVHADFVKEAVEMLKLEDKIRIFPEYFGFYGKRERYHIILLLNVIHHLGDDFEDNVLHLDKAKEKMLECINAMALYTDYMIFQMGYNWCGDKRKSLFDFGTKSEMIDFISKGTKACWNIVNIGVADNKKGKVGYYDLDNNNIMRRDDLGEFLNRPIFIMKSST